MKNIIFFLSMISFSAAAQQTKFIGDFNEYPWLDTNQTVLIEKHLVDLDFDNKTDTITLEAVKELVGDPQLFHIIRIKLASGQNYVLNNVAGFTQDLKTATLLPNRINSDKLYIPTLSNVENYLIIWDYPYPSCEAFVSIFKLDQLDIQLIYDESIYLSEIGDSNQSGKLYLKGKTNCEADSTAVIFSLE